MAIYIDELRDYRALRGAGPPGLWCHMITDGDLDELHEFAMRLGLGPRRFQNHPRHPHYDLTPPTRALAVVLGAVETTTTRLADILLRQYPL
jgi:hypothetical protein